MHGWASFSQHAVIGLNVKILLLAKAAHVINSEERSCFFVSTKRLLFAADDVSAVLSNHSKCTRCFGCPGVFFRWAPVVVFISLSCLSNVCGLPNITS